MSTYSQWQNHVWDAKGTPEGPCARCGQPSVTWGLRPDRVGGKGFLSLAVAPDYVPVCRSCWESDDEQGMDPQARADLDAREVPDPAPKPRKRAARRRAAKKTVVEVDDRDDSGSGELSG